MAQRDIAGFKSTKDSRFADNSSGQIEEVDHRDMYEDTADSFLNITDHLQDDDTFASASATKVASSESVKAYVDAQLETTLQYTEVTISSAEILTLHSTPKVLIAAPGSNKIIKVLHGVIVYTFGTAAYSGGLSNFIGAYYGDGSHNAISIPSGAISQTASCMIPIAPATTIIPFSEAENETVSVIASAAQSGGDGDFVFKIWYQVIDLV